MQLTIFVSEFRTIEPLISIVSGRLDELTDAGVKLLLGELAACNYANKAGRDFLEKYRTSLKSTHFLYTHPIPGSGEYRRLGSLYVYVETIMTCS